MSRGIFLLLAAVPLILSGCSEPEQKNAGASTLIVKKPVMMQPFRYHKLIEVAPGQDFDVVSWGRGGSDTSGFIIMHSDSSTRKYTTTTGDLDGPIINVINTDMDNDGNPEIFIQAKTADTTKFTRVLAFEFDDNEAKKLDFPRLTSSQRKGYRGGDSFYVKEGKLLREFPIYEGTGKDAKPGKQKREIEYGFHSNSLSAKQLSTDSASTIKSIDKEPKKSTGLAAHEEKPSSSHHKTEEKHSRHHAKKERHHTETSHKKKRHHHHHRD